jgi:phosphoribosyl 1,2-cyclic phosphodiesterase
MSLAAGGELFIFDAGSGIRELGVELGRHAPRRLHLFITHTHWDHIQGFPFFLPAYVEGFEIHIYGAPGFRKDLQSVFSGQLDREYFPVQMEDMKAEIQFRHLAEPPLEIGGVRIAWELVQHPGATLGFKIEVDGRRIVWVPDNEIFQGYLGDPAALSYEHPYVKPYSRIVDFMAGVDLAIHEAQYTNEEYAKKIGWGHSSVTNAAALMKLAEVSRWLIVHHDPSHDDAFLEAKLNLTRQLLRQLGHPVEITHGYDGMTEYL